MEDKNFEELQNQFAILKTQLDKQEIVSDRLVRETMKQRTKDINKTKRTIYFAAVFCLLTYPILYYTDMFTLEFTIVTCAMMLFCFLATYYIHRPVDDLNLMRDDFTTVARVMAKFKKQYDDWLLYVAPTLILPWLAWACHEFAWRHAPEGVNPWTLALPLIIGAAIGCLIGYRFHRKAVNAAQDILDEIEMDSQI
ncbi:MAG: hypothetical protein K6C30_08930 [Bacteroidaceae bacterium]|nr:hypothetical protein [Bacteroidaceae bacterium]